MSEQPINQGKKVIAVSIGDLNPPSLEESVATEVRNIVLACKRLKTLKQEGRYSGKQVVFEGDKATIHGKSRLYICDMAENSVSIVSDKGVQRFRATDADYYELSNLNELMDDICFNAIKPK